MIVPTRTMAGGKKRVAILVPASSRPELLPDERISLRHLTHHLGHYDTYLIVPKGSPLSWPGLQRVEYAHKYFGSQRAHSRLMLSRHLWQRFAEYEFVLVCHLDSLVLSDQMEQWCSAGYDYIGAPMFWQKHLGRRVLDIAVARIGNGGFSLRRVSAMLRVLDSKVPQIDVGTHWQEHYAAARSRKLVGMLRTSLKLFRAFNGVRWETRRYPANEDLFWSDRARHYAPLNIAPVAAGIRFAFDWSPRYCFEQNGGHLPFGVHAWYVYDRPMWEPLLFADPGPQVADARRPQLGSMARPLPNP